MTIMKLTNGNNQIHKKNVKGISNPSSQLTMFEFGVRTTMKILK